MMRARQATAAFGLLLCTIAPAAQAQAAATATTTPGSGFGQMLFGLAAVIGLVFALAWLARRLGVHTQAQSPLLRHIAALSVGTRERVLIVQAGDQWLVLGVTANTIQTLHTLPKGDVPDAPALRLPGGFAALLKKAGNKHV
jgi:flagellar protein FliO/FliZ